MPSIKQRIAQLEIIEDKAKAEQRPRTDAERAVRASAILRNPDSPARAALVMLLERHSEGFCWLRLKSRPSQRVRP